MSSGDSFSPYNREIALTRHFELLKSNQQLPPLPVSLKVDLSSKNVIGIEQLLLDINKGSIMHAGKMLLARTIAPSLTRENDDGTTFTQLLLSDPAGELAINLFLVGLKEVNVGSVFVINTTCINASTLFEEGQIALLICHGHEDSFRILDKEHPFLQTIDWKGPEPSAVRRNVEAAEKYKEEGNQLFKKRRFKAALEKYNLAIEEDPANPAYYSNRSATYALLDEPKKALEDAEKGLAIDASFTRLIHRKARALFLLKNYEECVKFLSDNRLQSIISGDKELDECQRKAAKFLTESKYGRYDVMSLTREVDDNFFLDHADYFDETMLEIKPVAGYQHGLIARRKIEAGTLIIASKALFYWPSQLVPHNMPMMVAEKLNADPSLGRLFYKLYAGAELKTLQNYDEKDPILMDRIRNIVTRYFFNDTENKGLGFWMMSSFINFTCVDSNCDRCTIGDFKLVRTTRAVEAGEQLLLQLHPTSEPLEARDKQHRRFGNVCNCRLCLLESAEPESTRKQVALIYRQIAEIERSVKADNSTPFTADLHKQVRRLIELRDEARALRPNNVDLNPLADRANFVLGDAYFSMGMFKEAVKVNEEVFNRRKNLGWVMNLGEVAEMLAIQNFLQENMVETSRWVKELKTTARLYFGDENMLATSLMNPSTADLLAMILQLDGNIDARHALGKK